MIFDPDDFSDNPYVAGLNQIGHMIFGAAIASLIGLYAGLVVIAWEAWQYREKGALKSDYWADCLFWAFGIFFFSWYYFNIAAIVFGGFWMLFTWSKMK